jgi:hypothetical protein
LTQNFGGVFVRSLSEHDCVTIKAATAAAYEALGGVSRAAEYLGVRPSTLTKYASPASEWRGNFIRLDLAVALDRASEHPFLITVMDDLVRRERAEALGHVSAGMALRMSTVFHEVVREVAMAIEDGVIDAAERLAVRNRIVAAQRDLGRLNAMMIGSAR